MSKEELQELSAKIMNFYKIMKKSPRNPETLAMILPADVSKCNFEDFTEK